MKHLICDSNVLSNCGKGVRFMVSLDGKEFPAFAVRYNDKVYAYVNRCAHVGIELDWSEGEFFDYSGLYLICSTHGATYDPTTGRCVRGPCVGKRLESIAVEEIDGKIFVS